MCDLRDAEIPEVDALELKHLDGEPCHGSGTSTSEHKHHFLAGQNRSSTRKSIDD